jgi:hypothetical protein
MINTHAPRPYVVLKQFVFRGMLFKTGDTFDPAKTQCTASKLRVMIQQRLLDTSKVPAEETREIVSPPPAKAAIQSTAPAQEQQENTNSEPDAGESDTGPQSMDAPPPEPPKEPEKESKKESEKASRRKS